MHSKRDISGHSFTQSQCAGYESDPIRSVRSVTVSSPLVQMKPTTGRDGSRFGTVEQHGTRRGRAHRARYACLLGYPSSHVAGFLVAPPRRPHTVPVHLARQVLLEYYACVVVSCLLGAPSHPTPRGPARDATLVARAPHTCSAGPPWLLLYPPPRAAGRGHQLCAPWCDRWSLCSQAEQQQSPFRRPEHRDETRRAVWVFFFDDLVHLPKEAFGIEYA
jgi:hypothetical protein